MKNYLLIYFILFYFFQFTFIGKFFNNLSPIDNVYIIIFLPVLYIFLFFNRIKIRNFDRYILLILIPLIFDFFISLDRLNYLLFAFKYISLFFMIITLNETDFIDLRSKMFKYIIYFYVVSFIVMTPSYFGVDFLYEIDPSFLRKNYEGFFGRDFYTVTPLLSAYLSGEVGVDVFGFSIKRFTSFHIEPSNFTFFFIPILFSTWNRLGFFIKFCCIIMIILSLSVTSIVILSIFFIFFLSFNRKLIIGFFALLFYYFFNDIADKIIEFVFNKFSFTGSLGGSLRFFISDFSTNLFEGNSFNLIPGKTVETTSPNIFSFFAWLISLTIIFVRKIIFKKYGLNFIYMLLHALKSINHFFPSTYFLFYLLEDENKNKYD